MVALKRFILIFLFPTVLLQSAYLYSYETGSAETKKEAPFPETLIGEYVYYLDMRNSKNIRLLGILKLNNSTLIIRVMDFETGEESVFATLPEVDHGEVKFSAYKILLGKEKSMLFYSTMTDLLNFGSLVKYIDQREL